MRQGHSRTFPGELGAPGGEGGGGRHCGQQDGQGCRDHADSADDHSKTSRPSARHARRKGTREARKTARKRSHLKAEGVRQKSPFLRHTGRRNWRIIDAPWASLADITGLLVAVTNGEETARTRLIEAVYDELRRLARGYLRRSAGTTHCRPRRSSTMPFSSSSISDACDGRTVLSSSPSLRTRCVAFWSITLARIGRSSAAPAAKVPISRRRRGSRGFGRQRPGAGRRPRKVGGAVSSPKSTRGAAVFWGAHCRQRPRPFLASRQSR